MTGFVRQGPALVCDGVPLADLAAAYDTPLYVYSGATIAARYRAIDEAFSSYPHAIHYALKANSTLAIARLLRTLGSNVDANSGGEIDVALRAGFIPPQIVFTGVGKTSTELAQAIELGVRTINVESAGEMERIDALSRERQTRTKIALRVNPDIDARSHPHISTGLKSNKFGIAIGDVARARAARTRSRRRRDRRPAQPRRVADRDPRSPAPGRHRARGPRRGRSATRAFASSTSISAAALACPTTGSPVPSARRYADALLPAVRSSGLQIILEPGRHVIAPAGVLLTRVIDVKEQAGGRLFVIMDAGMTEIIRPMLYNAFHRIEPVIESNGPSVSSDIVGPLCESSDVLGRDRALAQPAVDQLYAVMDTGAYGSVMASNYNRRLLPAEVLVEHGSPTLIRRRQTLDDLLSLES